MGMQKNERIPRNRPVSDGVVVRGVRGSQPEFRCRINEEDHLTVARFRKALTAVFATVAALAAVLVAAPTASAYDGYPCHTPTERTFTNPYNGTAWKETVRYCPLWRGSVPVYNTRDVNSGIKGYLTYGGSANWFVYEMQGASVTLDGGTNNWWASTMADNGQWGWVPEVYFTGGADNEDDAGLLMPGPISCVWPCSNLYPMPPWRV
jgi:hypothetical protein